MTEGASSGRFIIVAESGEPSGEYAVTWMSCQHSQCLHPTKSRTVTLQAESARPCCTTSHSHEADCVSALAHAGVS